MALIRTGESRPEAILRTNMMRPANRKLRIPLRLRNAGRLLLAGIRQSGENCMVSNGAVSAIEHPGRCMGAEQDSILKA